MSRATRLEMLDISNRELPLTIQTELLSLNRTSLYYKPIPASEKEIQIKHVIDKIYTDNPYFGSRRLQTILNREGHRISRERVVRYMHEMGISAIYPKKNLSLPNPEHKVYPYLLRNIRAAYPNHVWGTDITYIRLKKGWLYLVAYIDWFSRYVLAWEMDHTMEVAFVLEALKMALNVAKPHIANSDQGSQFTSNKYTELLLNNQVKISMDGRGRCMDNIFTERFWRSLKYEEVYISDYNSPREARYGISHYINKYNTYRPHQSLNNLTPAEVYFGNYTLNDFAK